MNRSLPLLSLLLTVTGLAQAENWPEWRGPGGQGISTAKDVPVAWSETGGVAWKAEIPGRGHSTPVIWGDQIWLTTAIETAASAQETAERLKTNTGDQPVTVLSSVSLRAVCVDRKSGKLLHDVELLKVKQPQWVHQLNSYASPSPVIENGRLYAHFGSLGTACLDTQTQKVVWSNQDIQIMHENGPGSTPILWDKWLIIHFDGSDKQLIAAIEKDTGKVAWETPRSGQMRENKQQRKAYGTPLIVEMNGKPVVVSPAADWIYGYEPATGKELWKVPYEELGFSMSVRPVADAERVYISTCFGKSQMIALNFAGKEVPEVAWRNNKNAPKMCSPVLNGNLLHYVDDGGIVTCVDTATGEPFYRERLGGKFSASPVIAEGRIYFASREGVVTVLEAGKAFKILAQNTLDGGIMASPVMDDGALYLRSDKSLYRIGTPLN